MHDGKLGRTLRGIVEMRVDRREIRVGTPAYMSPEQLAGRDVTFKSDIYAIGLIGYELLTGQSPYDGGRLRDYARLREQPPAPPSARWLR